MDDLDAFFTDDAVNAFVDAINVDLSDNKIEFASKLIEDEELLL